MTLGAPQIVLLVLVMLFSALATRAYVRGHPGIFVLALVLLLIPLALLYRDYRAAR
jgi:hypothetical protein